MTSQPSGGGRLDESVSERNPAFYCAAIMIVAFAGCGGSDAVAPAGELPPYSESELREMRVEEALACRLPFSWERKPPQYFRVVGLEEENGPRIGLIKRGVKIEYFGPPDRALAEKLMGEVYEELRSEIASTCPDCDRCRIFVWLYRPGEIGVVKGGAAFYAISELDGTPEPWASVKDKGWTRRLDTGELIFGDYR